MHTHTPARRHFLKLSARLATLGLTGMGFGPTRSLFVSEAVRRAGQRLQGAGLHLPVRRQRLQQHDRAGRQRRTPPTRACAPALALTPARLMPAIADPPANQYALFNALHRAAHRLHAGQAGDRAQHRRARAAADARSSTSDGLLAPSNLFSHSDQTLQAQTATVEHRRRRLGRTAARRVRRQRHARRGVGVVGGDVPAEQRQRAQRHPAGRQPGPVGDEHLAVVGGHRPQAGGGGDAGDGRRPPAARAANAAFADGLQLAETLAGTGASSTINTVFPGTGLGTQLREVAKLIKLRSQIGPGRQVFFCSMGGFDTHTSQDFNHQSLLQQLSGAMAAFYLATEEIGLPNQRHRLHAVGVRPHAAAQRHRHRPRVGRPPVRPRRRGRGRASTAAFPNWRWAAPTTPTSAACGFRQISHLAVRRHARQVVRRLAGRTRARPSRTSATSRRDGCGVHALGRGQGPGPGTRAGNGSSLLASRSNARTATMQDRLDVVGSDVTARRRDAA